MAHWKFNNKQIYIVFLLASQILRKHCRERVKKNKNPSLLQLDTEVFTGFWSLTFTFQWGEGKEKEGKRQEVQFCSLFFLVPRNTRGSDVLCATMHR